jgi:hypothetical protein
LARRPPPTESGKVDKIERRHEANRVTLVNLCQTSAPDDHKTHLPIPTYR